MLQSFATKILGLTPLYAVHEFATKILGLTPLNNGTTIICYKDFRANAPLCGARICYKDIRANAPNNDT
jgi:hypothetical protein